MTFNLRGGALAMWRALPVRRLPSWFADHGFMELSSHGGVTMDFRSVKFDDTNPATRVPCILLLDTSMSMQGSRIAELNRALQQFATDLTGDTQLQLSLDINIVTFGPIQQRGDFVPGSA